MPSHPPPTPALPWVWERWQSLPPLWVQMPTECAENVHGSSLPQISTSWRLVSYRVLLPRSAKPASLMRTNLPSCHGFSIRGRRPLSLRFFFFFYVCFYPLEARLSPRLCKDLASNIGNIGSVRLDTNSLWWIWNTRCVMQQHLAGIHKSFRAEAGSKWSTENSALQPFALEMGSGMVTLFMIRHVNGMRSKR